MNAVNWLSDLLAPAASIDEPDYAVAALVDRCGRLTAEETDRLAGAWATVEGDPRTSALIAEGHQAARALGSRADQAADDADWAFRWTLGIPSDGALYADNDPIAGRAIRAIRARAAAIATRNALASDLTAAMSAPWHEVIGD
jgi:hypothetical protein